MIDAFVDALDLGNIGVMVSSPQRLEGPLVQLDTADRQEPTEALAAKAKHLKEKLAKLDTEMKHLAAYEGQMLASPDQQISLTILTAVRWQPADAARASSATSGRPDGQPSDRHARGDDLGIRPLAAGARVGKAAKAADSLETVADRGYLSSPEILECYEAGHHRDRCRSR